MSLIEFCGRPFSVVQESNWGLASASDATAMQRLTVATSFGTDPRSTNAIERKALANIYRCLLLWTVILTRPGRSNRQLFDSSRAHPLRLQPLDPPPAVDSILSMKGDRRAGRQSRRIESPGVRRPRRRDRAVAASLRPARAAQTKADARRISGVLDSGPRAPRADCRAEVPRFPAQADQVRARPRFPIARRRAARAAPRARREAAAAGQGDRRDCGR